MRPETPVTKMKFSVAVYKYNMLKSHIDESREQKHILSTMLSAFHLNGHSSGVRPQAQKLEKSERNAILNSFHLNGHNFRISPTGYEMKTTHVQHNQQHHRKIRRSSLYLNGRAFRISPTK